VQGDDGGDAGRSLSAFDLDQEMVVHAQAVGQNVVG